MTSALATVFGVPGCRISVPQSRVVELTEKLLGNSEVKLAGLGARDSLRLEAGLCLYGNDIDESTHCRGVAGWTIGHAGSVGVRQKISLVPNIIVPQIKAKTARKRVGLVSTGPREVTSGCPSPCLKKNIAMGYVDAAFAKKGQISRWRSGRKPCQPLSNVRSER
ncbi:hypothetical protein INR49_021479 [Caranx melampygus]|nr:hypothetical protein INR49_021479 [Caranx melampygus]